MEKEKNNGLFNSCRLVENYNPYDKAVWLDTEDGKKPYLCVNERIEWYTRYCEEKGYVTVGIATEYVPELTKQGMITMKATVMVGTSVYTGYGSRLVDSAEGYSGDDIESAETRAIGRALRNAGFGSPFDDSEDNPVDGFKPQPKNGWVIEIQEASVVKETAVHQIFNSLFDGTELVQLPDGSMITPHPNFIAVFTTNVSYEGCNAMNQSLISRNQFVAEIQLPSKEETISRLKTQLNWPESKSTEAIDLAVQCMQKINEFLQEENLEDGSCDFRCIKDWLQMYLAYNEVGIKKSLLDLADYCIIPKATLDSEYHHDIRAICSAIIPAA